MPDAIPISDRRALDVPSLYLSRWAMAEAKLGAATQTLAVLRQTAQQNGGRTTFIGVGSIAVRIVMSERQVHRHLEALESEGVVKHHGRQLLPGSKYLRRRTVTYEIHRDLERLYAEGGFNRLPCYLLRCFTHWADRAVLAAVINRAEIAKHHGSTRDTFSLNDLRRETGLSRHSIIRAKRSLFTVGIIDAYGGNWNSTNELILNDECLATLDDAGNPIGIRQPTRKVRAS